MTVLEAGLAVKESVCSLVPFLGLAASLTCFFPASNGQTLLTVCARFPFECCF